MNKQPGEGLGGESHFFMLACVRWNDVREIHYFVVFVTVPSVTILAVSCSKSSSSLSLTSLWGFYQSVAVQWCC